MAQRGYTLLEMTVALGVGTIVVAAGFVVTGRHTEIMGDTHGKLNMLQSGHRGFRLLKEDLKHAGLGVGYGPNGAFRGFLRGDFTVPGGAQFGADDREVLHPGGTSFTDDLGLFHARGGVRTISYQGSGFFQICAGSGLAAGDIFTAQGRIGRYSRSLKVQSINNAACLRSRCTGGCQTLSWLADETLPPDSVSLNASYAGGEVFADLKLVTWFIALDSSGKGELRRAEIDSDNPCTAADSSCGGVVAEGIDSLQISIWSWDKENSQWVNRTRDTQLMGDARLRVDVELIARSMWTMMPGGGGGKPSPPRNAKALAKCKAANCSGTTPASSEDGVRRWALRGSVEIRNSGRMRIK